MKKNKTPFIERYGRKRDLLIKQMQTLKQFEQSDESVKRIFDIARSILENPKSMISVQWLLANGGKLAGYYGYLATKGNEAWAEYKIAEIAFKEVHNALVMGLKGEKYTITEARATAGRETADAEVDVVLREKRAKDFEAATRWCQNMLVFIQSTLKQLESERTHLKIADRGRPHDGQAQ